VIAEKRKRKRAAAGEGSWAGGPAGLKGKGVRSSLFFLFLTFSNSNLSNCFQIISNIFKTFETSNLHKKHYCHTSFSKENQVQTYMHARIKFHAYSDI
jgi:hypothetical protein